MAFNILVADDSSIVRTVVARSLSLTGIQVGSIFSASDGAEALRLIRENWIDLVFLDLHMPVLDGLAVMEALAADDLLRTVPVVVISSDASPAKVSRSMNAGAREFIVKPFTPETVCSAATRILGGERNCGQSH